MGIFVGVPEPTAAGSNTIFPIPYCVPACMLQLVGQKFYLKVPSCMYLCACIIALLCYITHTHTHPPNENKEKVSGRAAKEKFMVLPHVATSLPSLIPQNIGQKGNRNREIKLCLDINPLIKCYGSLTRAHLALTEVFPCCTRSVWRN